jgi:hypothetical protein
MHRVRQNPLWRRTHRGAPPGDAPGHAATLTVRDPVMASGSPPPGHPDVGARSPDGGTVQRRGGDVMEERPPWSDRRRRTLVGLALGGVAGGLGAVALPDQYGVASAFLGVLCGFLLVVAAVVFVLIPGPGTLGTLLRTVPLAGAVLVVAVLLLLSAPAELRWLWSLATVGAAAWAAAAVWEVRRRR